MISVVIPTEQSADVLPRCFQSVMAAAIDGLVREVIVADAASTDLTLEIADGAGATILDKQGDLPARLRAGAAIARHPFLLFLSPRAALESGWETEVERFLLSPLAQSRSAIFRHRVQRGSNLGALARLKGKFDKRQRLLIARDLFMAKDGHSSLRLNSIAWFC